MPELPEVETVKNLLKEIVIGRSITKIDVLRSSTIEGNKDDFISSLTNEKFLDIQRIGKYLVFHLSNERVILSHLRMEGKYYEVLENDSNTKYARVVFHLNNGRKICYDDSRCFGILKLSNEKNYLQEKEISKLGPEPSQIENVNYLIEKTKNKKLAIKTTLLDQTLMTGLGNIYVDETLYASNIHPTTPAYLIKKKEWESILLNAKRILALAINAGGSTIKSYHPGKGIDGNFQTRLQIYGKKGEICPKCGSVFRFIKVNGRGTTFCPNCQHKHAPQLFIGVTGKIASGKSEVIKAFKERGYDTISADEIVQTLYLKKDIVNKIEKTLHLSFKNHILDKKVLRDYLTINPKEKKKLEKLIHPLVKKEIIAFFNDSSSSLVVAEVPLLFEAKFENIFDYIIGVDISSEKQIENINKRNGNIASLLLEINKTSKFEQNKKQVEYLLHNDNSLINFKKDINKVIDKLEDCLS